MAGRAVSKAPQFGAWLRARRLAKRFSMQVFAERLRPALTPQRINPTQILRWERGRLPTYTQLCAIADTLGIGQADILSRVRDEMGPAFIAPDLRLIHKNPVADIGSLPDTRLSHTEAVSAAHRRLLDEATEKIATLEAEIDRLTAENAELTQRLEILRLAITAATVDRVKARTDTAGSRRTRGRRTPSPGRNR